MQTMMMPGGEDKYPEAQKLKAKSAISGAGPSAGATESSASSFTGRAEVPHDLPPDLPNIFSDGRVKQPKSVFWQTGGAGVWWPRRKMEDKM